MNFASTGITTANYGCTGSQTIPEMKPNPQAFFITEDERITCID
jgi:hypothetical protein